MPFCNIVLPLLYSSSLTTLFRERKQSHSSLSRQKHTLHTGLLSLKMNPMNAVAAALPHCHTVAIAYAFVYTALAGRTSSFCCCNEQTSCWTNKQMALLVFAFIINFNASFCCFRPPLAASPTSYAYALCRIHWCCYPFVLPPNIASAVPWWAQLFVCGMPSVQLFFFPPFASLLFCFCVAALADFYKSSAIHLHVRMYVCACVFG